LSFDPHVSHAHSYTCNTCVFVKLSVHQEGMPEITNAPVIFMGHHSFASFVPEVLPKPVACMCRVCGPPCNVLCCPCFGYAVATNKCDAGICGQCCCPPQVLCHALLLCLYILLFIYICIEIETIICLYLFQRKKESCRCFHFFLVFFFF
jgi:hypothetical protein